jgi:hypothetical protein
MTKTILIAAASAVALAGCVSARKGGYEGLGFDPRNPQVFVVDNGIQTCPGKKTYIVVDQEPIYFFIPGGAQAFPIIWNLKTTGYSFVQDNNIADPTPLGSSPAGGISGCRAGGNTMQCTNNAQRGAWKYTLRITADNGCGNPADLDPTIGND